jgi:hopanoid biosynthesis associated radical SAM protein HpnH
MAVPVTQALAVTSHVLRNVVRGKQRYPLVLMLEPLFRCNLACAGCGKIQYPAHVLKRHLGVEDALAAAEECGAPIVSIAGGEPLMHPEIEKIAEGLMAQGRFVYLCTNALLLEEALAAGRFRPNKRLTFNVHLDGPKDEHDFSVCRQGTYDVACSAIRAALAQGYRVTTNTTLFVQADADRYRDFFDELMELGVEGITISPGYSYEAAPDQDSFLNRSKTEQLFRSLLANPKKSWRFNHSPLFLEFLQGMRHYECTPWGNPTYSMFGWQRPCYLLQEGYAESFEQLMTETDWANYGLASGNPKCADCMVHSGHEATAVHHTFSSLSGFASTVRAVLMPARSQPSAPPDTPS